MKLTWEWRSGIALALAILLALTAVVLGSQRQVHAETSLAEQILCFVDQSGDLLDGDTGTFPLFNLDDCNSNGPIVTDWCPNIPGDQTQDQLPCIPLETDVCPNIDGLQVTVPEGKVLEGGMCVDAPSQGSGADLFVAKTVNDTSPTPSSTVVYTITVTNRGPATTSGVSISDMLPAGVSYVSSDGGTAYSTSTGLWTIGAMASGTTATLTITVVNMATSGVEVVNTASVADSGSTDPNSANNSSTVSFVSTQDQGGGGGNPQCSDGIDNDNDGDIDYPADNDCESVNDDKEEADRRSSGGGSRRSPSGSSSSSNVGEVLGVQTGECPMYLVGYIRQGASNDMGEVAKLQVFLNTYEGSALSVTGIYDDATLAAVNDFQRKYASDVLEPWGLSGTTGYVYYTTQKQVNTIYCKFQKDFPLSAMQLDEIAYVRAIQPTLGASSVQDTTSAGQGTAASAAEPTAPAVGQTVLPQTGLDENAVGGLGDESQSAAAANATTSASTSKGWFTNFVDWLFGR